MRVKTMLAALAAMLFAAAAEAAPDSWTVFTDPTGTFSLSVPEAPQVINNSTTLDNGKKIAMLEYMIDRSSYAMLTMVSDYSGMSIDASRAVDSAVTGVQQDNRTLQSNTLVTLDGHTGRDVTLTDTSGNRYLDRIFFFDNRLYQTITVVPKDASADQTSVAARYAQSLHFLR